MKSSSRLFLWAVSGLFFLVLNSCSQPDSSSSADLPAKSPLELLHEGNVRFKENHPIHPDQTLARIRELKKGQHPFAVLVSCSDSRVPPELIFDQGLGDLFVVRNAGNIISDYELGSIEYAVEHLDVRLIVVLGHKECGAIGAFVEHQHDSVANHIQRIIDYIKMEPEEQQLDEGVANYYEKAIVANVQHGVQTIATSEPVLREFVATGRVQVIGMLYDLETGGVEQVEMTKPVTD